HVRIDAPKRRIGQGRNPDRTTSGRDPGRINADPDRRGDPVVDGIDPRQAPAPRNHRDAAAPAEEEGEGRSTQDRHPEPGESQRVPIGPWLADPERATGRLDERATAL